jgi:signal transduction histidine kinase
MMMENDISEEQQERISGMMRTVNRLKKIVHSLLYISRIDNDQFAKSDTVEVGELSMEVMEELAPRLETKSIQFNNKITSGIKLKQVNRDLIFQLLYNLINNAIRYNKENGSIYLSDRYDPEKSYIIFIEDTGVGIREEELETIFDRFKKSGKDKGEGYGLGLSIVKSIISFHDFAIKASSNYGNGTIFSIIIPAEMVEREDQLNT